MQKKVRFNITGDELALDKTIVESLNEPLVHLLRNALDHGLETPEERAAAGKDETGTVNLTAYRKGETAYVEVSDDGRGLNAEKILKKARERGLVDPEQTPPDEEVIQYILSSGFSTAEKITDVSGRGVGMAFDNGLLHFTHALEHPLSAVKPELAHGLGLSMQI